MDQTQARLRDITVELAEPELSQENIMRLNQEREGLLTNIDIIQQRLTNLQTDSTNAMRARNLSLIRQLNNEKQMLRLKQEELQPQEIEEIREIQLPQTNRTITNKCFNPFLANEDDSSEYLTGRKLFIVVNIGSQGEQHVLCFSVDNLRMLLKDDAQIKIPCIGPRQVYRIDAPESDRIFRRRNNNVIEIIIDTSNPYLQTAKELYDSGNRQQALATIFTARQNPNYLVAYGINGPPLRGQEEFPGFVPLYQTASGDTIDVISLAVEEYFNERPFDKIENLMNNEIDYKNQYIPLSYPNSSDEVTGVFRAYLLRDDILSIIVITEALRHQDSQPNTFPVFEIEYDREITHTVSRKLIRELRHKNNPDIPTIYIQYPDGEYDLDPDSELSNLYISANHCQAGSSISVFRVRDNLENIYNDWLSRPDKKNDEVAESLEERTYYDTDPRGAKDWYEYYLHSSIMKPHYDPSDQYGEYWPGHINLPPERTIIRTIGQEPELGDDDEIQEPAQQVPRIEDMGQDYDNNIENLLPTINIQGIPITLLPSSTVRPGATRITNILQGSGILQNRQNLDQDWTEFLDSVSSNPEALNFYGYYLERLSSATRRRALDWMTEINEDSAKAEEEQILTPEQHFLAEKLAIILGLEYMGWNQNDPLLDVFDEGLSLLTRDSVTEQLSGIEFTDEEFDDKLTEKTTEIVDSLGPENIQGITSVDTRSTFTIRLPLGDPVKNIIKETLIMQVLNTLEIPIFSAFINVDLQIFNGIIKKLLNNPVYVYYLSYMDDVNIQNDVDSWISILLLYILRASTKGFYSPVVPENDDDNLYFERRYGIRLNQRGINPTELLRRTPDTVVPQLSTILSYIEHNNNNQTTTYIYANDWNRDSEAINLVQPNAPSIYDELETSYIIGLIQNREFSEAVKLIRIINAKNLLVHMFGETKTNGERIYTGFRGENQNFLQVFKDLSIELGSIKTNIQQTTPGLYTQIINTTIQQNIGEDLNLTPQDVERLVISSMKLLEDFYEEPLPVEQNPTFPINQQQEGQEIIEQVEQRQQAIDQAFNDTSSDSSDDEDDEHLPASFYDIFRRNPQNRPP